MSEDQRRYQFLLGFLIERGVLTEKRYGNGTWSLQGIYGVDDSGLRGAGRTPEEAIDNAIVAVNLDPQAARTFWTDTHAALAGQQGEARPAPTAPNLACPSVQARLAEQWGYVRAPEAQAEQGERDTLRALLREARWVLDRIKVSLDACEMVGRIDAALADGGAK